MRNYLRFFVLIGIALVLVACPIKNERLPKFALPIELPVMPSSIVQIPLVLKSKDLKQAFYQHFPNPVLEGKTEELKLQLSGRKKETDKNFLDKLASPLLKWVDKTFYVSSKLAYALDLSKYDFWFEGDQFYADVLLDARTTMQLRNEAKILNENIRLNGDLNCPMQVRVVLNGKIELTKEASINILLNDDDAKIKFQKVCSSKAIQNIDFPELLRPIVEPVKRRISKTINKIITQQLQRLLNHDQTGSYLSFKEKIDAAAWQLGKPYELTQGIWLVPKVEQVFVSPVYGVGLGVENRLEFCIGVKAKPVVTLAEKAPNVVIPKEVNFAVNRYPSGTLVCVNGSVPLTYAAKEAQIFLKNYVDQNYAQHGYTIGNVSIYPNGNRAAIAIEVLKAKNNQLKATLYLSGVPKYDTSTQEVYLSDLKFTTQSKNILLQVGEWLMHPKIMKQLKENLRFGISSELKRLQKELNYFQIEEHMGTLTGRFPTLDVQEIFISEHYFEVYLQAEGALDFKIKWQ
ncbi:DUF4403 family protein [Aureispira sp. CCB-QB1]|uniref:DUF4403 family protein n=1 Tax=Aureispira sp. CCB-QB1 TaxID=1313421 RepID=UPI0006987558|nr:DUF4403 family protein [Aureispira sp. CCB-QB1]